MAQTVLWSLALTRQFLFDNASFHLVVHRQSRSIVRNTRLAFGVRLSRERQLSFVNRTVTNYGLYVKRFLSETNGA